MAVILSDRALTATVHEHQFAKDSMGSPVRSTVTVSRGPYPGAAAEQPDGTWRLRCDPAMWELRPADELTDGTNVWTVTEALLHSIPGHPDVDHVAVTATLNPPKVP